MCFGNNTSSTKGNQLQASVSSNSFDPFVTSGGQDVFSNAQNWLRNNPWKGYGGPVTAAFGPGFGQANDFLSGQLGQTNHYTTQGAGAVSSAINSIDPNASIQSLISPYVQSALGPTLQNLNIAAQQQGQGIDAAATNAGSYGGTASGVAHALLDRSTQQNIAGVTGNAYDRAYNAAQNLKTTQTGQLLSGGSQLAGIGQQAFGQGTTLASLLAGLGSTQQQAGQQGVTNAINVNTQNQTQPLNQFSSLAQILSGIPKNTTSTNFGFGQNNSTSSTPNNSGFSLLGGLIGGLL